MPNSMGMYRKGVLIILIALVLAASVLIGWAAGFAAARGATGVLLFIMLAALPGIPLMSYVLYKKTIYPYYHRLEDANLELHLKQEELLDTKDDLFIKFLGIYDANYAANSPRLFENRLRDVADVTARVMEADACFIYLYDKKKDVLNLAATNGPHSAAVGRVAIPLGEGIEGWVGRRLDPIMLNNFRDDARFREIEGLELSAYTSIYCLPLYVYAGGFLVGVMELLYSRPKNFSDEEITFFTTLAGIISTTIQNEQLQAELRRMNLELEQWVTEKTEELRASEERYRTLVENACESIFVLAENGDILFANEQASRLTGIGKYDLVHKNLFELFVDPEAPRGIVSDVAEGRQALRHGGLRKPDGTVPVEISAVRLILMGRRFIQAVLRDVSPRVRLEKLLEDKEREITELKLKLSEAMREANKT